MSHQLPIAIDDASIEQFGREIDAIQREIKTSLGDSDRRYIKRMIAVQRGLAVGGRLAIFASLPLMPVFPLFLGVIGAGTAALGISKILENMEIGHNVIHGQWDWMQDPEIHSSTWEWDNVCPADQWKHSHNVVHHTWTNVLGKDRDVGYEILRWGAKHRKNPIVKAIMWPGILVQMITTKQPADDQIEVAIVSMQQALEADGETVPEGSEQPERAPLEPGGAAVAPA